MLRHLTLTLSLLVGLTFGASAFPTSYYSNHSRLASGNWVKIKTTESGMHQLTYQQLRELGFNDPTRVQVYGYSATCDLLTNTFSTSQPDDLTPIATRHGDGKIMFYGSGEYEAYGISLQRSVTNFVRTRTPYDTGSYYFLSDSQAPVEVSVRRTMTPATSGLRIFDSHLSAQLFEEELQNEAEGGTLFHGKDLAAGQSVTYTFDIPGYWPVNHLEGFTDTPGKEVTVHNRIGYNSPDSDLPVANYSGDDLFDVAAISDAGGYKTAELIAFSTSFRVCQLTPKNEVKPGDVFPSKASVTITQPNINFTYLAEDFHAVVYPRHNLLSAEVPQLLMTVPAKCTSRHQMYFPDVTTDEIEIWNVSNLYKIDKYPIINTKSFSDRTGVLLTSDSAGERLVAFMPKAEFPSPEIIGKVAHQDLHGLSTPNMVIITTAPMMPYAERLADLHRTYQNMDVLVVDHNLIYNEFSSGARSPMAYRRFLKMLYDRSHRLSHVLFFGPGNFDNRGLLTGLDTTDRLTLWSQDDEMDASNLAVNYVLDSRMGMLQDDYKTRYLPPYFPMQLAVGRLPLGTEEAPIYIDKVERWFTTPPPAEVVNNVVVIGGTGDSLTHLKHGEEIINAMREANPNLNIRPLHSNMYPEFNNERLADALKSGVGFLEYSGHGNPVSIENWSLSDANNTEYEYPVFAMISSCDQFALDHDALGLVRTMLNNPNGGIIAGVAASRGVYIVHNQRSALPFSVGYAKARPGQTIGEVYRDSRNEYVDHAIATNDTTFVDTAYKNMTSFNLAGDPAIPVYAPSYNVVINKINDTDYKDGVRVNVNPMQPVKITGYLANPDNELDKRFNGDLILTVFDVPRVTESVNLNGNATYKDTTIVDHSIVLARQKEMVENGRFEIEFAIPMASSSKAENLRMVITATNEDGDKRAVLSNYALVLSDRCPTDEDLAALDVPEIYEMEVEVDPASAFDVTGARATVTAVVDPSVAGFDFRNSGVASASKLTIDGVTQHASLLPYILSAGDGTYDMAIPVTGLTDGVHTARLEVVSATGAKASFAVDFTVIRETLKPVLLVTDETVTGPTEFDLDAQCDYVQIEVNDAAGRHVFTAENVSMPYKWDLKDSSGNMVEDGRYDVVARVRNGNSYGSAKAQIIVLK